MNYTVRVTLPRNRMTGVTSEALWIDMSERMERDLRVSCAQTLQSHWLFESTQTDEGRSSSEVLMADG